MEDLGILSLKVRGYEIDRWKRVPLSNLLRFTEHARWEFAIREGSTIKKLFSDDAFLVVRTQYGTLLEPASLGDRGHEHPVPRAGEKRPAARGGHAHRWWAQHVLLPRGGVRCRGHPGRRRRHDRQAPGPAAARPGRLTRALRPAGAVVAYAPLPSTAHR